MKYNHEETSKKRPVLKIVGAVAGFLAFFAVAGVLALSRWYSNALEPLSVEGDKKVASITVESGWSASKIADELESNGIIKNKTAFKWFVDRSGQKQKLQAGTYSVSSSNSVEEIVDILVGGKVVTKTFTILPAKRLDQLESAFIDAGFDPASVEAAFTKTYEHPITESLPDSQSLEGYIFPETYQVSLEASPRDIIRQSLDEFQKQIDDLGLKSDFDELGLSLHEAFTLASIVERESPGVEDHSKIAQVFRKRLDIGMQLGADATFYYAAEITGKPAHPDLDSPYNTRLYAGLPPGPISNFTIEALKAIANPADADYLYFVSGDDGTTYFSSTLDEHRALTAKYCIELCKLPSQR